MKQQDLFSDISWYSFPTKESAFEILECYIGIFGEELKSNRHHLIESFTIIHVGFLDSVKKLIRLIAGTDKLIIDKLYKRYYSSRTKGTKRYRHIDFQCVKCNAYLCCLMDKEKQKNIYLRQRKTNVSKK